MARPRGVALAEVLRLAHEKAMRRALPVLLTLLLVAAPSAAAERSPAGRYRLVGEHDVASELLLRPDGRFEYFLAAGALDERAQGRWQADGAALRLATEPVPLPAAFTPGPSGAAEDGAAMTLKVSWPDGTGIAGVDFTLGFDSGEPLTGYTQDYGWTLPEDETRTPRWIELSVPMHALASQRFPIDLGKGNALSFTLTPNDMGVVDFAGMGVRAEGGALIVRRWDHDLRYERLRE